MPSISLSGSSSPLLSRPFVDLGLRASLEKTSQYSDLASAYATNVNAMLNVRPGQGSEQGLDIGAAALNASVQLMNVMNNYKKTMYAPATAASNIPLASSPKRPSTATTATQQPNNRPVGSPSTVAHITAPASSNSQQSTQQIQTYTGRPSSPAGYSPEPWASSNGLAPPLSLHGVLPPLSTDGKGEQDNNDTRTAVSRFVLSANQLLSAPEVKGSLARQSQSVYADELAAVLPVSRTLLSRGGGRDGGGIFDATTIVIDPHGREGMRVHTSRASSPASRPETSDLLLSRFIETAVMEAQVEKELTEDIARSMQDAKEKVAAQLAREYGREEALQERVREQILKSHESRRRITKIREDKKAVTEARKAEKAEKREVAISLKESNSTTFHEQRAAAAVARKAKIMSDREARQQQMETQVFSALRHAEEVVQQKQREQQAVLEQRAREREEVIQHKAEVARSAERDLIARRAQALAARDQHHEQLGEAVDVARRAHQLERRKIEVEKGFKAEQRRRMIETKRAGIKHLGMIRQAQERVVATTHAQLGRERRAVLNRIMAEGLKHQPSMGSLEATPGPGEYIDPSRSATAQVRGGYMASSRVPEAANPNPGPGHYNVDGRGVTPMRGAIPFLPRGKTDVDLTILTASKLPGVGQYHISRPMTAPSKTVVFTKKGTSQLDRVIARAKTLPGPGDYDLGDSVPAKGGLERQLLGLG